MRGKLILAGGSPAIWSHNTSYVGISGLHSETSPRMNARKLELERRYSELISVVEKMHKKEMMEINRNKRHLDQSMLLYSDKVREIQRDRYSVPSVFTSSSDDMEADMKDSVATKFSFQEENSQTDVMSVGPDSVSSVERLTDLKNSDSDFDVLSQLRHRNGVRKFTYHGREIDKRLLDSTTVRHHSVTINGHRENTYQDKHRCRKVCTISPPNPALLSSARRSTDSAYESMLESDSEEVTVPKSLPLPKISSASENGNENSVQISNFPNIDREREEMLKFKAADVTYNPDLFFRKRKSLRQRKMSLERKERDAFEKEREVLAKKMDDQRKQAVKNLERRRKESKQEEKREKPIKIIEDKREVCQVFRYSVAMEELKKKPIPRKITKRDFICRVNLENGKIMNTLGPAVLKLVSLDDVDFPPMPKKSKGKGQLYPSRQTSFRQNSTFFRQKSTNNSQIESFFTGEKNSNNIGRLSRLNSVKTESDNTFIRQTSTTANALVSAEGETTQNFDKTHDVTFNKTTPLPNILSTGNSQSNLGE